MADRHFCEVRLPVPLLRSLGTHSGVVVAAIAIFSVESDGNSWYHRLGFAQLHGMRAILLSQLILVVGARRLRDALRCRRVLEAPISNDFVVVFLDLLLYCSYDVVEAVMIVSPDLILGCPYDLLIH